MMNKTNWQNAPEWARYRAIDAVSGYVHWFQCQPNGPGWVQIEERVVPSGTIKELPDMCFGGGHVDRSSSWYGKGEWPDYNAMVVDAHGNITKVKHTDHAAELVEGIEIPPTDYAIEFSEAIGREECPYYHTESRSDCIAEGLCDCILGELWRKHKAERDEIDRHTEKSENISYISPVITKMPISISTAESRDRDRQLLELRAAELAEALEAFVNLKGGDDWLTRASRRVLAKYKQSRGE